MFGPSKLFCMKLLQKCLFMKSKIVVVFKNNTRNKNGLCYENNTTVCGTICHEYQFYILRYVDCYRDTALINR